MNEEELEVTEYEVSASSVGEELTYFLRRILYRIIRKL